MLFTTCWESANFTLSVTAQLVIPFALQCLYTLSDKGQLGTGAH